MFIKIHRYWNVINNLIKGWYVYVNRGFICIMLDIYSDFNWLLISTGKLRQIFSHFRNLNLFLFIHWSFTFSSHTGEMSLALYTVNEGDMNKQNRHAADQNWHMDLSAHSGDRRGHRIILHLENQWHLSKCYMGSR